MPPPQRAPSETLPLAFLVPLLPLVLSPVPINLPRTLLAQSAQQAAHYLGLTAEDEEYWTLGRKDEDVSRLRRELVEAGSLDDLHPSSPRFSHDLEELRCLIPLSLPYTSSSSSSALGVVLVWEDAVSPLSAAQGGAAQNEEQEEEDEVRPGWTFLELQALSSPSPQSWYPSLDEALATSAAGLAQALGIASGGGAGMGGKQSMSARGEEKEKLMEAMAGFESDAASVRRRYAEGEEQEGGGDERNGGAIASAEDFWAGWDDEEGVASEGAKTPNGREAGAQEEEEEEKGYWDSYSGVGSQVGEDDESQSQLERIEVDDSTPPTTLAPHNPQPSFNFPRDSASSLPSSAAHSSTSPSSHNARPLYFSTTLPPPPDSHFGISPTQPNPGISRFSATDTSGGSHYDFLIEPSEDGEEEEEGEEGEFTPRKLDVVPARSASLAQIVPLPLSSAQPHPTRPAPTRPKAHARTASDILKALPSVPAFPVVSRPRPASNANGVGAVSGMQVLEGSVYVYAPGGGGSPTGATFVPTTTSQNQRSPTSPARTSTSASHPSHSASAPRSPIKALPPAPAPRTPTRAVSHSRSHSFASPSSGKRPYTQRSQSSSGVPRTPRAVSNGTGGAGGVGGAGGEGVRSPVRNGGFWAPPTASTSSTSSDSSSSRSSGRTIAISAPPARQGSRTTPLPSLAVFPSTSTSTAPRFALPTLPTTQREKEKERERERRSVDSTATGLTGMLEELVRGTMGDHEGAENEGGEGEEREKGVEREETGAREEEDEEEDEALKAALSGLWRMYSRAGRRRDAAGRDERRRRFETVVREVVSE
ncbi:hypothetical protein JCM10296v2_005859 [Rhodotorula toruloides]